MTHIYVCGPQCPEYQRTGSRLNARRYEWQGACPYRKVVIENRDKPLARCNRRQGERV